MGLFHKATKQESKLRLAIAGPSGSGKTYSALAIATYLGGKIALVDTEHGSASKYADQFDFDVAEMHAPYHPDKYIAAIADAAGAGYKVIILDSMTHAWNGEGGLLELVEQATKRQKTPNSYTAWADVTPIQNKLINAIVSANIHIIATIRSKQDYVQEKDGNGRTVIKKVGMAPVQRDGFEYEFDIFLDMDIDNNAIVSKSRCTEMSGKVYAKPGKNVAAIIAAWLGGEATQKGAEPRSTPPQSHLAGVSTNAPLRPSVPSTEDVLFDRIAAGPKASQQQLNKMNALGLAVYKSQAAWEQGRPKAIGEASGGKIATKEELSPEQADWIIASLEEVISKRAKTQPVAA